jgi:hypothetical protein
MTATAYLLYGRAALRHFSDRALCLKHGAVRGSGSTGNRAGGALNRACLQAVPSGERKETARNL